MPLLVLLFFEMMEDVEADLLCEEVEEGDPLVAAAAEEDGDFGTGGTPVAVWAGIWARLAGMIAGV